jgi:transcription elongation factor GreA
MKRRVRSCQERIGFVEGRIQERNASPPRAVIEDNGNGKPVGPGGSKVSIGNGFDAETYTIVGAAEANPREGKISNESPIGKAIIGTAGEEESWKLPADIQG